MKNIIKKIYYFLLTLGLNPLIVYYRIKYLPTFIRQYWALKKQAKKSKIKFPFATINMCVNTGNNDQGGIAKGHYFHQDLLVARKIFKNNPEKHIDIGSRVDGFVAHIASFREVEIFDIRSIDSNIKGIKCIQADLMDLDSNLINYCDSISSLHAIEHFGLGRYGDKLDFEGYLKGLDNIYQILKKTGHFYFSVPIGKQRIEFNAHRVFSINYLLELLENKYTIINFSYVDDKGDLFENISLEDPKEKEDNYGCFYGCGIFDLVKK